MIEQDRASFHDGVCSDRPYGIAQSMYEYRKVGRDMGATFAPNESKIAPRACFNRVYDDDLGQQSHVFT